MIVRWDIITIGNISRNRYWGESDEKGLRSALCTCTLVTGEGWRLLVDPSIKEEAAMAAELYRRSGLGLGAITHIYITHPHSDHHDGLANFPAAAWLAAADVAADINREGHYGRAIEGLDPATRLLGEIDLIHTPGHTEHHYSLRFDCEGASVVVAGDATMTRDFFRHRQGYFNSTNFAAAAASIERLAQIADIVIPGHDNYFLNARG